MICSGRRTWMTCCVPICKYAVRITGSKSVKLIQLLISRGTVQWWHFFFFLVCWIHFDVPWWTLSCRVRCSSRCVQNCLLHMVAFSLSKRKNKAHSGCASEGQKALQFGQPSNQALCSTLAEAEPLACAASPIPLLPHSLSPSSLHIVLLPISLSVINYKRHKPPGLMPCHGCLPSCTFWRAKRLASLITPGTLSVSPFAGRRKSPRWALHRPEGHRRFFTISWWSLLF